MRTISGITSGRILDWTGLIIIIENTKFKINSPFLAHKQHVQYVYNTCLIRGTCGNTNDQNINTDAILGALRPQNQGRALMAASTTNNLHCHRFHDTKWNQGSNRITLLRYGAYQHAMV